MKITSRDNPTVREIRKLLSDAKLRRESGLFVLEGARLCGEGARYADVRTVLYTPQGRDSYPQVWEALMQTGAVCAEIPESLAGAIADTEHPQGLFCVCRMRPQAPLTLRPDGRYLALENLRDPSNLGTVIRTAEAFGLDALLLSDGCCDVYNPKVLRGSMGGSLRLPMVTVGSLPEAMRGWQEAGLRILGCVADAAATPLPAATVGAGCVCLIGNEANGLTAETQAGCTDRITIPMRGRAESLNAAVAACIVLWELCR